MISGTPASQRNANVAAKRSEPLDMEAEIDRQLELMIKNIVDQLMEGQDGLTEGEARMDALVMLTVTAQVQADDGGEEGDLFLLWLLEEKQKREMS